jgi:hypothetical protein
MFIDLLSPHTAQAGTWKPSHNKQWKKCDGAELWLANNPSSTSPSVLPEFQ